MGGIFINYRREDSSAYAGRLYDKLVGTFGRDRVFIDIDTIRPGEDFREVIERTCTSCEILLAVIGRNWTTVQDKKGKVRLENDNDLVRMEIASALQKRLHVIPVLVAGAEMPEPSALPRDLQGLAYRNAWEISDKRFHQDTQGLIEAITEIVESVAPTGLGDIPAPTASAEVSATSIKAVAGGQSQKDEIPPAPSGKITQSLSAKQAYSEADLKSEPQFGIGTSTVDVITNASDHKTPQQSSDRLGEVQHSTLGTVLWIAGIFLVLVLFTIGVAHFATR